MRDSTTIPQNDTTVDLSSAQWSEIDKLKLKSYIEFPETVYSPSTGSPSPDLKTAQTMYERVVVTRNMSAELQSMTLLHPHKHVDYRVLPTEWLNQSDLVIAKVAGYDRASFGLPAAIDVYPLLVKVSPTFMVAATQLSHARTRRFAPSMRWMRVLSHVVSFVTGQEVNNTWMPTLTSS